jgi:phosphatidylserine decarboxylase
MSAQPVRFFNRRTGHLETEQIFGERWLRLAYENPVGRGLVWLLARRALFSKWYGRKMNRRDSALQILPFIAAYDLDVDEFAKSPFDYKTFNEFFYRALRPEARPITPGDDVAVFPADGRHLGFANVDTAPGFYVKGATFTLAELFGSAEAARPFAGGAMLISRLCPVDYHRFHFPVAGTTSETRPIGGWLYSVSPIALRHNLRYLVENKRAVTLVDSPAFGTVAVIEVGATNVGSIQQTFTPGQPAEKGAEKGFFAFGGSCVITVFQAGRIRLDADLLEQSSRHIELYARVGDRLGVATRT